MEENKTQGRIAAIVLAGGSGKRMGGSVPKQYRKLCGRPMITYSLEAFEKSEVDQVVLVTGREEVEYCRKEIVEKWGFQKVTAVVPGGKERYHSVYQGLKALKNCDYVLIHDGARPLLSQDIIERAISGAVEYEACVIGMPVKDTIKVADEGGFAVRTPDRGRLWQIQTPQAFAYELARRAYDRIMADETLQQGITDDAMVVERAEKIKVKLIPGSYENLKVTTPEDLYLAEALLARRMAVEKVTVQDGTSSCPARAGQEASDVHPM